MGGLIQSDNVELSLVCLGFQKSYLGNLFKNSKIKDKKEVIGVLTPHVIDTGEKSFSYVIQRIQRL